MAKAIIFDLFHTLTAPEAEWSDLPWTSDVLGISRADWYRALTLNSRQRLWPERIAQLAEGADAHITHLDGLLTHPLVWPSNQRVRELEGEA